MLDLNEVSSTTIGAHKPKRWGARIARIAGFAAVFSPFFNAGRPKIASDSSDLLGVVGDSPRVEGS